MAWKRRTSLFTAGLAAAAALLGGAASSIAWAAASAGAPAGRAVGFTDYTDNDGVDSTVILTGGIGDFGQAVSIHPDGTPDPEHTGELRLELRDGTFRIDIAELDRAFVAALEGFPADTVTCSGVASVEGTAPIVAGSGTGAYRGVAGVFHLTVRLAEDQAAGCAHDHVLLKQLITITGSGRVTGL